MANTKGKGMGKGLGAFGFTSKKSVEGGLNTARESADGKPKEIELSSIKVNSNQPRREFNEEALQALSISIKQYGVIQPVVVRKVVNGYELIAGERRYRASRMAGLATIPAVIREYNDAQMTEVALIENIQREDLNVIEEANAYQQLLSGYGLTQELLSRKVGRSRSHIANFLRLLNLSKNVQQLLVSNKISMGQAKPLLGLEAAELQDKAAAFVMENDLTARKTEELVKRLQKNPQLLDAKQEAAKPEDTAQPVNNNELLFIESAQEKLKLALGANVIIKNKGKKKHIEIDFSSDEELERLISYLTEKKSVTAVEAVPSKPFVI